MPKTHGYYLEPWYNSYRCMMDRCYRVKAGNFKDYGGRGISVCDDWKDIENFRTWALTTDFKPGMTLERIDPNDDYSPKNCRWATWEEQANNRRNTVFVTYNGITKTLSWWAKYLGVNKSTLKNRFYRGMPIGRVLESGNLRNRGAV